MTKINDKISVLLSQTEGGMNLGMICRSMANTGFKSLRFTGELQKDDKDARMLAVHASSILDNAHKCDDFTELCSGSDIIIGLSPRDPWGDGNILEFSELASKVKEIVLTNRKVGILFGNERTGLTNDELSVCKYRVALPANPDYVSLNLAQAAMVVLWELHVNFGDAVLPYENLKCSLADGQIVRQFTGKLRDLLLSCGYLHPENPEKRWREISLIFESRDWTDREATLMLSIFGTVLKDYKAKFE